MNVKTLILISVGSLLVSIALIFGLLYLMQPPAPSEEETAKTKQSDQHRIQELINDSITQSPVIMQNLVNQDSLDNLIAQLKAELDERNGTIDSLEKLIEEKSLLAEENLEKYTDLQASIDDIRQKQDNAKSLAKTFETMKTGEISRSVASLDDQALMQIYHNMNSRHRKNLLMALSGERAARLTKKMMSLAGE
jgi:flagellar motility protein MotE (MotC chaperone)